MGAGMSEEWRPVVGYEGLYEVSSLGRVRGVDRKVPRSGHALTVRGRIMRPHPNSRGHYLIVDLTYAGQRRTRLVHRLVGEAFFGPLPHGLQTRHLNGNSFDNRLVNLRYGTRLENVQDAIAHGTHASLASKARTHCPHGHEFTPENTWRDVYGCRVCRRCSIDRSVAWQRKSQAEREAAGEVTPRVIRQWAAPFFGIDPTRTGRIHDTIKWAYAYAHPEKGWTPTPDPRRTSFVPPSPEAIAEERPDLRDLFEMRRLRAA